MLGEMSVIEYHVLPSGPWQPFWDPSTLQDDDGDDRTRSQREAALTDTHRQTGSPN